MGAPCVDTATFTQGEAVNWERLVLKPPHYLEAKSREQLISFSVSNSLLKTGKLFFKQSGAFFKFLRYCYMLGADALALFALNTV